MLCQSSFRSAVTGLIMPVIGLLLTAFCLLPSAIYGQAATATLSGTVVDQNGAVVVGVNITLINNGTTLQRQAVTNEQGGFAIPLLPPGPYTLNAQRDGFSPVRVENVVLNVGDQKALQIQLKAGDVNAQVTVDSNAETVRTDGSVGTVVDRQFVANIPLNGRSFNTLLELTPGVVLTPATNENSGQFSANGQRTNANYFMVDGVGANIGITFGANPGLGQTGGGSLPATSALGGTNTLVSVDAVQEFKVLTSGFAPEFGRSPGAQVSIITRSGSNQFHGTVFDYFRNEALDANDWFANSRRLKRAPERQNDFGGTFSGPILLPRFGEGGSHQAYNGRDKTFFFFSYEGLRLRRPVTRITAVPTLAARQAAPNAVIGSLLNAQPLPNGRDLGNNAAEFASSLAQPVTINATSLRVDNNIGKRFQVFARFNEAPSHAYQQGAFDAFALSTNSATVLNIRTLTGGVILAWSPTIINDLRINWSRVRGATILGNDNFGGAVPPPDSFLFPAPSFSRRNTLFNVGFGNNIRGYDVGRSTDNKQRQQNVIDNLSIVKSTHQLKFGIDYRRLNPENGLRGYGINVFFTSVAQALTGTARLFRLDTVDTANLRPQFINFSAYSQDTWQAGRKLSVTYGLRWEYDPPPTEKTNGFLALTSLDNLGTVTLARAGTPLWKVSKTNFAPRFGLAYQLMQKPGKELTLRGGLGVFYDLGNPSAAGVLALFPYVRRSSVFSVPFPVNQSLLSPIPFSLNPPFGLISGMSDPDLKLPFTYQWNLAFQQSLGLNQSVTATYVGAAGRRLYLTRTFLNPSPNFTSLGVTTNGGTSDYHALQLQFQRRLSHGLQALGSYTWSHSIDVNSSADNFELNAFTSNNVNGERGNSAFDIRHSVSVGVTYSLPTPLGARMKPLFQSWWIDCMFRARSGAPVNITSSRVIAPFGQFQLRPDVVPGVPFYVSDPTAPGGVRFNRAAFVIPTALRQGMLPRNTLRGFPVSQLDVAIRRQINLTEKVNLQLRVEAFNVFNHPNFADPVGSLDDSQFGLSGTMLNNALGGTSEGSFSPLYQIGGPRSLQLALKFQF